MEERKTLIATVLGYVTILPDFESEEERQEYLESLRED